jgi:hypothetical protein
MIKSDGGGLPTSIQIAIQRAEIQSAAGDS